MNEPTSVHAQKALYPRRLHQAIYPRSRGQKGKLVVNRRLYHNPLAFTQCSNPVGLTPVDHLHLLPSHPNLTPYIPPLGAPSSYPLLHKYLHSFVDIFSMLVLKSSLGQVNGEHTGHPQEPCHASIDDFCCDTGPWEGGRHRVSEGNSGIGAWMEAGSESYP